MMGLIRYVDSMPPDLLTPNELAERQTRAAGGEMVSEAFRQFGGEGDAEPIILRNKKNMTELTKTLKRETGATVFEKSQHRNLIVSIEPAGRTGAVIGVRVKGTRQTYRVGINSIYLLAVDHHLSKIERRAKELHKKFGLTSRKAKAQAIKEIKEHLK